MSIKHRTAVIKVGGDVLLDRLEREGLARNIKKLLALNWRVVVLHGGGPQTNLLQEKVGLTALKIGGRRVTSKRDLAVVKQAIAGEVNVDLTALLTSRGINAFGCHGASGQLVNAVKRPPMKVSGHGNELVDYGEVGDVLSINRTLLEGLLSLGVVPVIATLGCDANGRVFNINADTTVVKIAAALKADLLLLTTKVGAVFEDLSQPDSRVKEITPTSAKQLIEQQVIQGGMIPKVEEAISLLDQGVSRIAIVSPKHPDAFTSVVHDEQRFGTVIHS